MADDVMFEIDDAKSFAKNREVFQEKLKALHPKLGAVLATFLPQLEDDPNADKTAMLIILRAELDEPPGEGANL